MLVISFFLFGCVEQAKKSYPIFVVTDTYNLNQKKDSNVIPQIYELESVSGLILDCSKYNFALFQKMNENKLPDQVRIMTQAGIYTAKLNAQGQTIIDNSTMKSILGNKIHFKGFVKGDTAMLFIGTKKNNVMETIWRGKVAIK